MSDTSNRLISCSGLSFQTPFTTIEQITIGVDKGEWVEVVGPPRSGKSVIFQVLSLRTLVPNAQIYVKARNIDRIKKYEIAKYRRAFASCAQRPLLLQNNTVAENLFLPGFAHGNTKEVALRANDLLEEFDMLDIKDVLVKHLSYQDRILVAVARTLVEEPEMVIIDSVFDTVSTLYQKRIFDLLRLRHAEGTAILLFAQGETKQCSDTRVIRLQEPTLPQR